MKRLVLALALSFFSASHASAQEVEMVVRLLDGTSIRLNIDSITRMRGTEVESPYRRIVNYREFYGENSKSAVLGNGTITFHRTANDVYLSGPGAYSKIAGDKMFPPASFLSSLTFQLHARGENITQLNASTQYPVHVATAWHDSSIYASTDYQHWRYTIDSNFNVVGDGAIVNQEGDRYLNIELNRAGTKLAYSGYFGRSEYPGQIYERDLATGREDTITLDTMISTVRYVGDTDDMVYYSFGSYHHATNPKPDDAGYYFLDRSTGTSKFLLHHPPISDLWSELLNGFDVSSDGKKLLVPKASSDRQVIALVEYDIETGTLDTLNVNLYPPRSYNTIWTQYNNDDTKILYSVTWFGRGPSYLGGESSVGIIDRATLQTQQLFVSPTDERPFCAPFPRWSPDETAICYGGCIIPEYVLDSIGPFYVYIKKL